MFEFRKTALTPIIAFLLAKATSAESWKRIPFIQRFMNYDDQAAQRIKLSKCGLGPDTSAESIEYLALSRPHVLVQFFGKSKDAHCAKRAPKNPTNRRTKPALGIGLLIGAALLSGCVKPDTSSAPGGPNPDPGPGPGPGPGNGGAGVFETAEYNRNYGLGMIGAASRYAKGGQGQNVTIAILDTGIDINHTDFTGKIDFANSYGYFGNSSNISDTGGHGTHVAGIAAARRNNKDAHGVAFASKLVIFKGIPGVSSENSTVNVWADALVRASNAGASVMNNSWGYSPGGNSTIPITDFKTAQELRSFLGTSTINALNRCS